MSSARVETLDLGFQGTAETIASFLVTGPRAVVLVESGPGSTLPRLIGELEKRELRPQDVEAVLLTHIHLDHAGAAGWWALQGVPVYVHPIGAPHLVDPSKLLASAERIYRDRMHELWGETLAAPADRVMAIEDGDRIEVGGLEFEAIETPGHAGHHHVYRLGEVGFVGDALGILLPGRRWIDLPAPPPEFDLNRWRQSLDRIRDLGLARVYRTHFDESADIAEQLESFEALMLEAAELVRDWIEDDRPRDEMIGRYEAFMRRRAEAAGLDAESARAYELANPRAMSVDGIARFWRKRIAGS